MMISQGTRVRAYNGMLDVLRKGNLGALLVPLLLLLVGWGARATLSRKTVKYSWRGVTLAHPVGWAVTDSPGEGADGNSVVLVNLLGPGRIKPRLTLRVEPMKAKPPTAAPTDDSAPAEAAPTAEAPVAEHLPLYYEMAEEPVQVGTFSGTRVDSAFAFTPKALPGRKGDIPVVMRAIDLVVMRGVDALSVQVAAPIDDFEAQRPSLESIIASLNLDPMPAEATPPDEPVADEKAGASAVTVTGQIVDAQSGLAVPGAIVLFLAPGTSVGDVDDDNLTRVAYTTGMADSTGHFAGTRPLSRAAHYGVMVVADGYRWIGTDDAVAVGEDGPLAMDMGSIPLRRR
ncbi:MAG TPA: hypothetical protein VGP07_01105 [Polyangia bacterium]|jgi:hypothetical protein